MSRPVLLTNAVGVGLVKTASVQRCNRHREHPFVRVGSHESLRPLAPDAASGGIEAVARIKNCGGSAKVHAVVIGAVALGLGRPEMRSAGRWSVLFACPGELPLMNSADAALVVLLFFVVVFVVAFVVCLVRDQCRHAALEARGAAAIEHRAIARMERSGRPSAGRTAAAAFWPE